MGAALNSSKITTAKQIMHAEETNWSKSPHCYQGTSGIRHCNNDNLGPMFESKRFFFSTVLVTLLSFG